jgi:hypothetical protein
MSVLDNSYDQVKGSDSSGAMTPTILDCTVGQPEIKKTKDGSSEYISLDLAYKRDDGEWGYLRFQNFNPEKSAQGAQLWKNFLIVAGAKNGNDLKGRKIKAVVNPEPYTKQNGEQGKAYRVFEMGYFSEAGLSAGEIEDGKKEGEKMMSQLQKALELPVAKTEAPASTPEDSDSEPF